MATSKGYKALFIRADAREAVDEAKKVYKEREGVDLNYSQFIIYLCNKFMSDMKLCHARPQR